MATIIIGFPAWNTLKTMGISIPKVPHEVPVENDRPTAIRKMIAGSSIWKPAALPSTRFEIYIFAPRESVIALRVHAQQRISIAETIALKPSGRDPISSLKLIFLLKI